MSSVWSPFGLPSDPEAAPTPEPDPGLVPVAPRALLPFPGASEAEARWTPPQSNVYEPHPAEPASEAPNDIAPDKRAWVGVTVEDDAGAPMSGVEVRLTMPDGEVLTRRTDRRGQLKMRNVAPGQVEIELVRLDEALWAPG